MRASYRELPKYLQWIPVCVTKGRFNIHISTVTNWIPVSDWTWTGSLQFRCFSGPCAIMTDGEHDIKYSLEMFSRLIPYMKDGKISGTFHYEPYGTRMLHYVPILPDIVLFSGVPGSPLED